MSSGPSGINESQMESSNLAITGTLNNINCRIQLIPPTPIPNRLGVGLATSTKPVQNQSHAGAQLGDVGHIPQLLQPGPSSDSVAATPSPSRTDSEPTAPQADSSTLYPRPRMTVCPPAYCYPKLLTLSHF